jgi:DNA-binding SARP family transcriptional activator
MRINGIDLARFSPHQRAIVAALGLRAPGLVRVGELVEAVYPDPDNEPDTAAQTVAQKMAAIRRKWSNPIWRIVSRPGPGGGYYMERIHASD